MKTQLTALEIFYLVKELQILVKSKIDKIYQTEKKELYLQLHSASAGKRILKLSPPSFMYMTSSKQTAENLMGFCAFLRKHIQNLRIDTITQPGFERIVEIALKDKKLIIELFNKGNILLTQDNIILGCAENQIWQDRTIKPGEKYYYTEKQNNVLVLKQEQLETLLRKTAKSLVKFLATDLSLGGIYAEELCAITKIDKKSDPKTLRKQQVEDIFNALQELLNHELKPAIAYSGGQLSDITPFPLRQYADSKPCPSSFNETLDAYLPKAIIIKQNPKEKELIKLKNIIAEQHKAIHQLQASAEEAAKKADNIYHNYQFLGSILDELKAIVKKHSAKEIQEKLKGHKLIKSFDPKEKTITVELQ